MRISSRLQTFGHPGNPVPPAFAFNCTAKATMERAKLSGLQQLQLDDDLSLVCLSYGAFFPEEFNTNTEYNKLFGATELRPLTEVVGTNQKGVAYDNATPNTPSAYRTINYKVPANTPHTIRGFLAKKPKTQALQLDQFRWGGWIFEILEGKPQLLKVSAQWSQAQEDALHALLAVKNRTAEQEVALDTIKKSIYEAYESLDLNARGDDWYGTNWMVTFIPEPRGVVHVLLEGAGTDSVKVPSLLAKRTNPDQVWPEGPVTFRTYGGAAYWQLGYPLFAAQGEALFENRLPVDYSGYLSEAEYSTNASKPLGTTLTLPPPIEGGVSFNIKAIFEPSSDKRRTPFLYSFIATRLAGDRTGLATESFDTNDLPKNPIKDIGVAYEAPHNRRRATVLMRDINGTTLAGVGIAGYGYDALENRVCNLSINNAEWLTGGLIIGSRQTEMRKATENQARTLVTLPQTDVELYLCDGWQLLDETPCNPPVIGDNARLGMTIRRVLNLAGFSASQMSEVSANAGPLIPGAAAGEEWREMANPDASCGDYLRHLMECYGLGLFLRQKPGGIWALSAPPTDVVAAYVSAHTGNPNQMAHRRIILRPLEYLRDYSSFYNVFRVEGGNGPDGKPLVYVHRVPFSIDRPDDPSYLGRKKVYQTLRNEGLCTKSEVVYAGRSLAWLYGRKGRYASFETFFSGDVLPWLRITLDGALYEVQAVNGSIARDRMQVVVRQI